VCSFLLDSAQRCAILRDIEHHARGAAGVTGAREYVHSVATDERVLASERLEHLRDLVRARRVVRIEELRAELGVSLATVRRDLSELEARGELRRVHGGAVSVEDRLPEPLFDAKAAEAIHEKQRIAAVALGLVGPGETIYLDSGSTVLELARLLRDRADLTVVTNSLPAAVELAGGGPRVIVIGGELRTLSRALVGPLSRLVLDELFVDRAFMGTFSLSLLDGLSTTDPGEAFTKRLVLDRARQVVLLADSRKAGTRALARAGDLDRIHLLVTDEGLDAEIEQALVKRGIRVIRA
jgi:DeoR family fructose operon transcriptional repressor